jgi:hypothetical protein
MILRREVLRTARTMVWYGPPGVTIGFVLTRATVVVTLLGRRALLAGLDLEFEEDRRSSG